MERRDKSRKQDREQAWRIGRAIDGIGIAGQKEILDDPESEKRRWTRQEMRRDYKRCPERNL